MKVKLNPMFEQVSGQLGEMVFRELNGKTVVSRKPLVTAAATENQTEHRERFKQAAAYGKAALADPATRTLYETLARSKNIPVFAMTIADFFNAPVVDALDLATYSGQPGDLIRISARDEVGVVAVQVSIADSAGNPLESGAAVQVAGHWVYTATETIEADTSVVVQVVATDRPGGMGVATGSKTL